ncbi:MAG: DUF3592 domain-containing protein [Chloroflexi bacterium]|nr:DUF3592 domain-containing protein [Chloroflexota bacterium]
MGNLDWIITGLGLFAGIAGAICTTVIPILIIGGLGYFLYKRNQQSMAYRQSTQTWLDTTGTILMSSVQSHRTGRSRSIYPVVVYTYSVHGKSYQSQRIKAGEQFLNVRISGQAQATVNRYPIGTTVTVYYNPSNPAECALEK